MSRRKFCAFAGSSLVSLGLAACAPGDPRVVVGDGVDNNGLPTAGGPPPPDGGSGADLAQAGHDGGVAADLASGSHDMASVSASCGSGALSAGPASAVASGDAKLLTGSSYQLFLCRDAGGLYAMDAGCTHEGKLLVKQATSFYCSRHGARFDLNGEHPTLPAFSPLDHYSVCVDASGNVTIDYNKIVPASTRV
jgi:nitrite reductase/ring-hydroxylating ferredoxin subunit